MLLKSLIRLDEWCNRFFLRPVDSRLQTLRIGKAGHAVPFDERFLPASPSCATCVEWKKLHEVLGLYQDIQRIALEPHLLLYRVLDESLPKGGIYRTPVTIPGVDTIKLSKRVYMMLLAMHQQDVPQLWAERG